jgi:hypothetical protein
MSMPGVNLSGLGLQSSGLGFPSSLVIASQVIIIGGKPAFLAYYPTKGAGNLIASVSASTATAITTVNDGQGNAVLPGIVNYYNTGSGYIAEQLYQGVTNYLTAATEAGPWTIVAQINGTSSGSGIQIASNNATGNYLVVQAETSLNPSPSKGLIGIETANAGDDAFGIRVLSDVHERFFIDSNGKLNWGTGAAVTDTTLYRAGVNELETNGTFIALAYEGLNGANSYQVTTAVDGHPVVSREEEFTNVGAAPAAPTTGVKIFAEGGNLEYVSGNDGQTYDTGTVTRYTAGQAVSSTAPAAVVWGSGNNPLIAAGTYHVYGKMICTMGATSAAGEFTFTSTGAVSAMRVSFHAIENVSILVSNEITAIGSSMATGTIPNGTAGQFFFDGIIEFSAAGNLGLEVAEGTTGDAWTLNSQSWMAVEPVVA